MSQPSPSLFRIALYAALIGSMLLPAIIRAEDVARTPDQLLQLLDSEVENLRQAIQNSDFDTIEKIDKQVLSGKHPLSKYGWVRSYLFSAYLDDSQRINFKNVAEFSLFLERWRKAKPSSSLLPIVEEKFINSQAWEARGGGYANTISKRGAEVYHDMVIKRYGLLTSLAKSGSKDPEVYADLIDNGRDIGAPKDVLEKIFEQGAAIAPNYRKLYLSMTMALLPKWGGQPGELEKFAEKVRKRDYAHEGNELYAKIAWSTIPHCQDSILDEYKFSWPVIRQGYQELVKKNGFNTDKMQFARMAVEFGDRETAAEMFSKIGDGWDPRHAEVWKNVSLYKKQRDWALGSGERSTNSLLSAAARGTKSVEEVLNEDKTARLDSRDDKDDTPLAIAVRNGNTKAVFELVEKGAEVNVRNHSKVTPLHLAAMRGETMIAKYLLEHGAKTEVFDRWGRAPIHYAAENGFQPVAALLLSQQHANPDVRTAMGRTPLYIAASHRQREFVRYLLQLPNVDVNSRDYAYYTPLHAAASSNDVELVKILIDKGADVQALDMNGKSALEFAKKKGASEIVQLLQTRSNR